MEPVSERQQVSHRQVLPACWVFETGGVFYCALRRCGSRTPRAADAFHKSVTPEFGLGMCHAVEKGECMSERLLPGLKNRILQVLARVAPGATTTRVRLNRWRGVNIGKDVWIGYDAIIETSCPHLVTIRDRAAIGIRVTIIAHNREQRGVVIEEDAVVGAGAIVLPNVTIGRGAIVTAGSVVTKSVPPKTMVQGNPAQPIATVEIPFGLDVSLKEFAKGLRPIRSWPPDRAT